MRYLVILLVISFGLCATGSGGQNPLSKVAIHVLPHSGTRDCQHLPTPPTCMQITTTFPGSGQVDAFPVFYDLVCTASYCLIVNWDPYGVGGSYCYGWQGCADQQIVQEYEDEIWLEGHYTTGKMQWSLVIGWLWLDFEYEGYIQPRPHEWCHAIQVDDCLGDLDDVICTSSAGVGGMIGDDPCRPTAAEPVTWGSIKSIFR